MGRHQHLGQRLSLSAGLVLLALLLASMSGCGGLQRSSVQPAAVTGSSAPAAPLPAPSTLHGSSYTQQDLTLAGSEYSDALPHDRVWAAGSAGVFMPNWGGPAGHFEGLAYATYEFHLADFDLYPALSCRWTTPVEEGAGWLALADFSTDSWAWRQLPLEGGLFDPASNISDTGTMYVIVLLTGKAECRLAQLQISGEWTMLGHDPWHTRRSQYVGPASNALKWEYATGGIVSSSPAIAADGTVYVGSYDGKLHAVNADGSPRWTYEMGEMRTSPAIGADGTVYVNCGQLYAINPDGSLKWSCDTGGGYSSPALGADGTVYVGGGQALYAINRDGSLKWSRNVGGTIESSPAIGADGTLYITRDGVLYAFSADGVWQWEFGIGFFAPASPAIGADGTVYVGSADRKFYAVTTAGEYPVLKWTFTAEHYIFSSAAIGADGTLYFGSDDHLLYAINPDGSPKWTFATGSYIYSSPAIDAAGTVYVGSLDDQLYAINADGSLQWAFTAGGDVQSSPAIGPDGTVYVGSNDGKLYAIGPGAG